MGKFYLNPGSSVEVTKPFLNVYSNKISLVFVMSLLIPPRSINILHEILKTERHETQTANLNDGEKVNNVG